jgi:hypothetical protein
MANGRKDKLLERYGLLNYQTKNKTQAEIAAGYAAMAANNGPQVDQKWFNDQYGEGQPSIESLKQQILDQRQQTERPQTQNQQPIVQYSQAENGLTVKNKVHTFHLNANSPKVAGMARGSGLVVAAEPDPMQQSDFIQGPKNEDALAGKVNWSDVSVIERNSILADPDFYKNNEITKYPKWMQQQILADPSFDWEQVPKWQRAYFDSSSRPAVMGGIQGGLMGSLGGPVGGVVGTAIGATLGAGAGWAGYDQTKEWWNQGDGKWTWDKQQIKDNLNAGFGLANWAAEKAEQSIGLAAQIANAAVDPNKNVKDLLSNFKATWNAGASFFEVITPAFQAAMQGDGLSADDALKIVPSLWVLERLGDLVAHPEKYKGQELYLGAATPVKLDQSWIDRLDSARKEIADGRNYREVMTELQTGVLAQLGDMVGQAVADPLNALPRIESKVGEVIATTRGDQVVAEAFRSSEGLVDAAQKYKTIVQTGQAFTIDPNFKTDQMGWLSRMVAGVNRQGEVKAGSLVPTETGLLDPVTKEPGFLETMTTQTPHSRAQTAAGLFYENIGTLMTMFEDPHEAAKYLSAISKGDNETWAQLGTRFANSPEFYTVLPALKAFASEKLDGVVQSWDITAPNRDMLTRLSDVLGEEPARLLNDLARRGTSEQDFARIVERLNASGSPEAKAWLADIDAGKFTAATLKQTVDIFTGEGALPWHPGQWKALMLDTLGDHFDQWVTQRLMLDKSPEAVSAFFRTTALLKQAQSILLLGGSPGYAITNGLSNMVHRAATGIYGYLSAEQINSFMDRLGVTPARFEEGVGIGGQVEMASGSSQVKMEAMNDAIRGQGALATAKDVLGKISKGMPFSKLSSWFERMESKQAFAIAMKQFWSESWRRGRGFSEMAPDLVRAISDMGIKPERIYAAIEAGMNQAEIEKALFGRFEGVQARSLVNDAAQKIGMTAGNAARMLDEIGVLDALDAHLKGQSTPDGVRAAFQRANAKAQDWIDMQTGEDLKAIAQDVKNRVGLEGATAALDVAQQATATFVDAWMDHYSRFGEIMNDLALLDDPAMRSRAIDYSYQLSDDEFRRVYARHAANYQGIFEAWGVSGNTDALNVLAAIGEGDTAMRDAYRQMREIRKGFFDKYRNDFDNPAKWDEWHANNSKIDRIFKQGFEAKHQAEVKMGASLAKIYESLYGVAAGEAARQWWEDVVNFNDEIVAREKEFRDSLVEMTKEQRDIAKQEYYSKTKLAMIAEVERINGEGIARLERVIKGGGSTSGQASPAPTGPIAPEDSLRAMVNQQYEAKPPPPTPATPEELNARLVAAMTPPSSPSPAGLTPEARDILAKIDEGGSMPAFVTSNLRRVAADNGVHVTADMNAQAVIDALRSKEVTESIPAAEAASVSTESPAASPEVPVAPLTPREQARADEINTLLAAAERRRTQEAAEQAARISAVWDTAEGYWGNGANYSREILQDKFALIGALRKPEYGGNPELTGLSDPRLTPELVQRVLDARKLAKEGEAVQQVAQGIGNAQEAASNVKAPKIDNNTTILRAISEHGGIWKGVGVDEMARMLADDGYPIDLNDANDPGGIQQTMALINRARSGDKIYPTGHDHEAMLARVQNEAATKAFEESMQEQPFDAGLWQSDFAETIARADLTRMYDLIGSFPEELNDTLTPDGETYREFMSRVADETAARVEADALDQVVAEHASRVQDAIDESKTHADAVTTRNLLKEKFQDVFGLKDDQAQAYMELSDAVAKWYEQATGENADQFYSRYYQDVVGEKGPLAAGGGRLDQINPVNRAMTPAEIEGYARALVRAGEGELKTAIQNEASKADRVAILDAAHKLDPTLAENVAKKNLDLLFQNKDAVTPTNANISKVLKWSSSRYNEFSKGEAVKIARKILNDDYWVPQWKDSVNETDVTRPISPLNGKERVEVKVTQTIFTAGGYTESSAMGGNDYLIDGVEGSISRGEATNPFTVEEKWFFKKQGTETIQPSTAKGAVTFDENGIKATIHAFESRDFSTLVHENAHVFRRMLSDVADRTNNPQIRADLATIEEWAGVKNGEWNRAAEEKFARGFEHYIATGNAPTPKLVKAFRLFKSFMLEIYKTITGSAIDVKLTPEVQDVFARMMGADGRTVADFNGVPMKVGDPVVFGDKQMVIVNILEDGRAVLENEDGDQVTTSAGKFEKIVQQHFEIDEEARAREAADVKAALLGNSDFAEQVRRIKEARAKKEQGTNGPLFQDDQPFGAYQEASQFHPRSEAMDQGWSQYVRPLMDAMQEGALQQVQEKPLDGAVRDMSPEGQAMLKSYMRKVQGEMATTKLATIRHGETKRDFAMLNYSKRYGADRLGETGYPYELYQTRTLFNWGLRAIDKPALFSNYARINKQQNRYERDIPERLRNKIKIPAPWLPSWAGGALYIDPIGSLFPPANLLRPFERMMQDSSYQQIEAERVLQEWAADGQYSQAEIQQAAQTRSGTVWERAFAEAQTRRESEVNNPLDFMNTMLGPAWYLTTPYKLAMGQTDQVNSTPLYNTLRGIDTVTQGTWAEPIGNMIGLLGKPEEWARKKLNIPEFGEYGDYYVDRQLANMVAEGSITSEQAQIAMIERQGELFDQARERVKMELALRVPTMGAMYATLHSGPVAGVQAFAPSLFGAGLLPAGELEYRGLKQEWNEAWDQVDKGNKGAINQFFDNHPEYEAYLAKGKPPEERLRSFLVGQIWDGYMALGETNQRQARAEMGPLFAQSFLNKETRSYDTLDVDTLTQWAQMLGKMTPVQAQPAAAAQPGPAATRRPAVSVLPKAITDITDQFFEQRSSQFPNYYEQQQAYYAKPPSERAAFLLKNPEYADYLKWRKSWYDAYPQYKPIFNGDAFDRVDTTRWPPMLEDYVRVYAMTGQSLPNGAYKSLEQIWIQEGQPMGDFKSWLNSTVVPSMLYGAEAPVQ